MSETKSYAVQINVKVGDHLINIQGDSAEEAMKNLSDLVIVADELHGHLERLDGRPATEVVQKEKQWGARSQYGRSYPKPSGTVASTATAPVASFAEALLKDQLGATTVTTQTHSESSSATNSENGDFAVCPAHGLKRKFYPAGENDRGQYSASWRCPAKGCRAIWQKRDGSWA